MPPSCPEDRHFKPHLLAMTTLRAGDVVLGKLKGAPAQPCRVRTRRERGVYVRFSRGAGVMIARGNALGTDLEIDLIVCFTRAGAWR